MAHGAAQRGAGRDNAVVNAGHRVMLFRRIPVKISTESGPGLAEGGRERLDSREKVPLVLRPGKFGRGVLVEEEEAVVDVGLHVCLILEATGEYSLHEAVLGVLIPGISHPTDKGKGEATMENNCPCYPVQIGRDTMYPPVSVPASHSRLVVFPSTLDTLSIHKKPFPLHPLSALESGAVPRHNGVLCSRYKPRVGARTADAAWRAENCFRGL